MDTTSNAIAQFQALNSPFWKIYQTGKSTPYVSRTMSGDTFGASYEHLKSTVQNLPDGAYTLRIRRTFDDTGDKDRTEIPFFKNRAFAAPNGPNPAVDIAAITAQIEAKLRAEQEEARWKQSIENRLEALEKAAKEDEKLDKQLEKSVEDVANVLATIPRLRSSFSALKTN